MTIFARFNYYPPCPIPENVLGQKPHSDTGTMTLLLQDEVEGLQVLKDNQWFRVPVVPQAIFVNIADRLEVIIRQLSQKNNAKRRFGVDFSATYATS